MPETPVTLTDSSRFPATLTSPTDAVRAGADRPIISFVTVFVLPITITEPTAPDPLTPVLVATLSFLVISPTLAEADTQTTPIEIELLSSLERRIGVISLEEPLS